MTQSMFKCHNCGGTLNNSDLARLEEKYDNEVPLDKFLHQWCEGDESEVQEEASSN